MQHFDSTGFLKFNHFVVFCWNNFDKLFAVHHKRVMYAHQITSIHRARCAFCFVSTSSCGEYFFCRVVLRHTCNMPYLSYPSGSSNIQDTGFSYTPPKIIRTPRKLLSTSSMVHVPCTVLLAFYVIYLVQRNRSQFLCHIWASIKVPIKVSQAYRLRISLYKFFFKYPPVISI